MWNCTKCNGDFPEHGYHYIIKLELRGHTCQLINVTTFDDVASQLMGIITKDLFLLSIDPNDMHEIISIVSCHRFLFPLSIKLESCNGVERLKTTLIKS